MVRRVHKAVKRFVSTASISRKRKSEEVLKTFKRKKLIVDESESKTESRVLADIFEYDESSAHEKEDAEDSEGKSEEESEEESESDSGDGEDRRDSEDGEEDPYPCQFVREISPLSHTA
ncbi:glutamic acid-rich protein-like [Capsicum annuum]|uniref:glutamic acid-rich protein-like n=1 Tax=Capsicum annuum TaxID=4072 RepID=UPI001FB1117C|nr:glutamic acid-rich protein-like [Capsicum annuum]